MYKFLHIQVENISNVDFLFISTRHFFPSVSASNILADGVFFLVTLLEGTLHFSAFLAILRPGMIERSLGTGYDG